MGALTESPTAHELCITGLSACMLFSAPRESFFYTFSLSGSQCAGPSILKCISSLAFAMSGSLPSAPREGYVCPAVQINRRPIEHATAYDMFTSD